VVSFSVNFFDVDIGVHYPSIHNDDSPDYVSQQDQKVLQQQNPIRSSTSVTTTRPNSASITPSITRTPISTHSSNTIGTTNQVHSNGINHHLTTSPSPSPLPPPSTSSTLNNEKAASRNWEPYPQIYDPPPPHPDHHQSHFSFNSSNPHSHSNSVNSNHSMNNNFRDEMARPGMRISAPPSISNNALMTSRDLSSSYTAPPIPNPRLNIAHSRATSTSPTTNSNSMIDNRTAVSFYTPSSNSNNMTVNSHLNSDNTSHNVLASPTKSALISNSNGINSNGSISTIQPSQTSRYIPPEVADPPPRFDDPHMNINTASDVDQTVLEKISVLRYTMSSEEAMSEFQAINSLWTFFSETRISSRERGNLLQRIIDKGGIEVCLNCIKRFHLESENVQLASLQLLLLLTESFITPVGSIIIANGGVDLLLDSFGTGSIGGKPSKVDGTTEQLAASILALLCHVESGRDKMLKDSGSSVFRFFVKIMSEETKKKEGGSIKLLNMLCRGLRSLTTSKSIAAEIVKYPKLLIEAVAIIQTFPTNFKLQMDVIGLLANLARSRSATSDTKEPGAITDMANTLSSKVSATDYCKIMTEALPHILHVFVVFKTSSSTTSTSSSTSTTSPSTSNSLADGPENVTELDNSLHQYGLILFYNLLRDAAYSNLLADAIIKQGIAKFISESVIRFNKNVKIQEVAMRYCIYIRFSLFSFFSKIDILSYAYYFKSLFFFY